MKNPLGFLAKSYKNSSSFCIKAVPDKQHLSDLFRHFCVDCMSGQMGAVQLVWLRCWYTFVTFTENFVLGQLRISNGEFLGSGQEASEHARLP